jgi:hypothetical protein
MKKLILLVALASNSAYAYCPHGEIRRLSLHRCVNIRSALARGYVHASLTPRHVLRRHTRRCDPLTQCGDPVEDRVDDPSPVTPTQSSDPTPRNDWLPDAFTKSQLGGYHVDWRL